MQANDILEYRNEIIEAFRDDTFSSEHLKKSDGAVYDYLLRDANNFFQEIKSMEEKINLSLFEDLFGSSSPADYARKLINIKNPDVNKKIVAEIKNRISDLKDRIKKNEWNRKNKNKNSDETLTIIKKVLNYNKNAQKNFPLASKVDKGKSEPKPEESIEKRVRLRGGDVAKIKREEKKHKQ